MKRRKTYMAMDQYGNTVHGLHHPRKELAKRFPGRVNNMYEDDADGAAQHVGYVVGTLWFSVYEVRPFKENEQ